MGGDVFSVIWVGEQMILWVWLMEKPTGQLFIDKNAALTCINQLGVVEAKTGETISTYALEKFMVNGDYDCSDAYRNIIQGELKQYEEQSI